MLLSYDMVLRYQIGFKPHVSQFQIRCKWNQLLAYHTFHNFISDVNETSCWHTHTFHNIRSDVNETGCWHTTRFTISDRMEWNQLLAYLPHPHFSDHQVTTSALVYWPINTFQIGKDPHRAQNADNPSPNHQCPVQQWAHAYK